MFLPLILLFVLLCCCCLVQFVLLFLLFVLLLLPLFGSLTVEKPTVAAFDLPKCQEQFYK